MTTVGRWVRSEQPYNTTENAKDGRSRKVDIEQEFAASDRARRPVMSVVGGVPDACLFRKGERIRPCKHVARTWALEVPGELLRHGACWVDPAQPTPCVTWRWT